MTLPDAATGASVRLALSGAGLLGFSSRRGNSVSAKAAFVGVTTTLTGGTSAVAVTPGATPVTLEPTLTVNPSNTSDTYSTTVTGFMAGDSITHATAPSGTVTCGGPMGPTTTQFPATDTGNGATSSGPGVVQATTITSFFESFQFSTTSTVDHIVTVNFTANGVTQTIMIHDVPSSQPNPMVMGGAANQPVNDNATTHPFTAVTVTDTNAPATPETATVMLSNAANGTLSGGGFTQTATAGTYTYAATSAADAQSALQAAVFTPTPNQVAPGQTVGTGFTITVADGSATSTDTANSVAVTSVNDAPTLGGLQTTATQPAAGSVMLQPGLTVTDPDVGASATTAQVSISAGFVSGDRLTVSNLPAGVTSSYNAATGVLTLTGAGTDAAYQAALRTVAFVHDGAVAAGTRTVSFTLTDDHGAASPTASETVNVGGYSPPPTAPPQTPSQQAGYTTQTDNLLRASPNDPALTNPSSPFYAQAQAEQQIATKLDQGQISAQDAQSQLFHLVDGTTSVAEISYAFFTGKTPTAAGLNYVVHSAANTTDLNDPYYAQFTTENRYINFAVNLATGSGAGSAQFQANYGSLSLTDATTKAYATIFGTTPTGDKIAAILNAQVSNGLGGTETRAQYFADITGGSAAAQKAAAIGFLLADSVKEGFGTYQQADLHFLQDLAHGTAAFNVDLLVAYGQAPNLVGQPVVDPTLGG